MTQDRSQTDSSPYDPEKDLSGHLSQTAGQWKSGFLKHWQIDSQTPFDELVEPQAKVRRFLDGIAVRFVEWASELDRGDFQGPEYLFTDLERVLGLTRQEVLEETLVRHRIEIELAGRFDKELGKMAVRSTQLLDYVVAASNETVRSYLARVADCYIRGMATEGVVMCRAVLEAAVKDRLKDVQEKEIRNNVPKCGRHITLLNYLTYAKNHTPFLPSDDPDRDGKSTWTVAIEVKDAGDNAVHAVPGLCDLDTKLRQLVRVVESMFPEASSA